MLNLYSAPCSGLYYYYRSFRLVHLFMNKMNRFTQLLELYISGNISADEHEELFDLIATHQYDDVLGKSIHKDLAGDPSYSAADIPPHIAEEIVRNIFHSEKDASRILPVKRMAVRKWWSIAAAFIVVAGVAGYLLFTNNKNSDTAAFLALIPSNTSIHSNDELAEKIVVLEDGSKVTLKPGSKLHYAKQFAVDKREVFLEGEAFFHITKNPSRPFYVYYNNIVTKVLGTSFNVNTNAVTGDVEVSVKTGKVQVYENEKLVKDRANKAVIVIPNQKAIYKALDRVFETALVEKPEPIRSDTAEWVKPVPFVYDEAKLVNVFRHIEANYGIEIVVENTNINNCKFTGDVSNQDLYTKLKVICLSTNSSYEINGTKILIKGNGCD